MLCFYSFDATKSEMLGKYVNHSTDSPNAKAKMIKGRICLFAIKDLMIGEELRYDYGISNLWKVIKKIISIQFCIRGWVVKDCLRTCCSQILLQPQSFCGRPSGSTMGTLVVVFFLLPRCFSFEIQKKNQNVSKTQIWSSKRKQNKKISKWKKYLTIFGNFLGKFSNINSPKIFVTPQLGI